MRLHGYYRSSTSYRLRIALELKGLSYENVPVNLLKSQQQLSEYTEQNPFASVPMLEAGDRQRAQSMAIIEWLDEAHLDTGRLLPNDIEQRFTVRELSYAIATELHAPLNLPVLKYLKNELGHSQDEIDTYYRHFLLKTLKPVETRLEQLDSADFLMGSPGLFETVLIPQLYNARRFDFDLSAMPRMVRIEQACQSLAPFRAAHPDNQPDNPENNDKVGA